MTRERHAEAAVGEGPEELRIDQLRGAPGNSGPLQEGRPRFFFFLAGDVCWEFAQRRRRLGPLTLCHLPANTAVLQQASPAQELLVYVIRYRPELLSPALRRPLDALGVATIDLGAAAVSQERAVRSLFEEMWFEQESQPEEWRTVLQARLLELAVRTLRLARRSREPVLERGGDSADRVARYALRLRTRFFLRETLAEAARSAGLGGRQFTELFRKVTGQTWRRHVLELRMKHAVTLLAETDRPVSAVAFESGFEDLSNFHHLFKAEYGCSPLAYRMQHRVRLPARPAAAAGPGPNPLPGFEFRGMKGWGWTPDQYLEEIPILAGLRMNFLMNCYRSMSVSQPGEPWRNEWWLPLARERREAFARIIRGCAAAGLTFCLALHPQLASPRPLALGSVKDLELFLQHYTWAQEQGVEWFAVCLDDTRWGGEGPAALAAGHAALVNEVFRSLHTRNNRSQMIFCPACFWGDGTNPEHAAYLTVVARDLHPDIYVFWTGDAIVTPRITRLAARSFRKAVQHRLFLWDNYPVNDGSPTMHLGPLSGRDPDLCEVIDGYLSNPMCGQNQINRIPLATAAEYALDPRSYKPARAIGRAIARAAESPRRQAVLKDLVEAYPGFIVAGGGAGTNPVRAKFADLLGEARSRPEAARFTERMSELAARLGRCFPGRFSDARRTLLADVAWMREQAAQLPRAVETPAWR